MGGMFSFRFSGKLWDMKRLRFGWNYSPVICQEFLGVLVGDLIPPEVLLIHYIDDSLSIARDMGLLTGVTGRAFTTIGVLMTTKSTLEPTDCFTLWVKFLM